MPVNKMLGPSFDLVTLTFSLKLLRDHAPTHFLIGRIGMFFFLLRKLSSLSNHIAAKVLQKIGELGMLNFLIMYACRYSTSTLALPESLTGKNRRTGKLDFPLYLFWWPWFTAEGYIMQQTATKSFKSFLRPYDLVYSADGDKIYVGTWPGFYNNEIPSEVKLIVDLSNEYQESPVVTKDREYICFPVWDQAVPLDKEGFLRMVERVASFRGPIYVHCGFGVGRSVIATICIMVKKGVVPSYQIAYKMIKTMRPIVNLKPHQIEFIEELLPRFSS
jgi:protein-tyrosine phosphatase